MRLSKQSLVLVGAAALLFGASAAHADDPSPYPECTKPPSQEDTEAAKSLHQIATARLNIQDWDKAIEFWKQAYALDCTAHPILQNIANAYEKKGDKKAAVAALETYLVRAPNAPDIVKVNERVIELKKSMEPAPVVTATATATATVTAAPTVTAVVPAPPRPYGSIPLIAAGVGGALAIAGAIMIPVGLGPYNTADTTCKPKGPGCSQDVVDAGHTGQITFGVGGAFVGIGLAAAAAGLGFHFVFNKPREAPANAAPAGPGAPPPGAATGTPAAPAAPPAPKAEIDVTPLVGAQFGGFSITGKF